ncbi:peptidase family S64 domain-containing protein [Histoplasma ohiense]|nr:peptidase family S64 domain-containing protein [Histoplasma ohiense (nom. inval.)]
MATVSLAQSPTFSEVARKRRLMSRSDEEIEDNIDIRIQYRTGWPKLAHLPLRTVYEGDPDAFIPDQQTHISQIITILRAQQIPVSSIAVVYRVPYGGDNSNKLDETTATLLVTTFPDGGYNSFVATREIRKYLNSHEIHVLIEIIDERALKPSVFPILSSDKELISIWNERLKQATIDILKASCLKVVSISVFRYGLDLDPEKCPPTVMISALDAEADAWWATILPRIRSICLPAFDVTVIYGDHIIMGSNELDMNTMERPFATFDFSNLTAIKMGDSCGPIGGTWTGSMGGPVRLEKDGEDMGVFGLSNHHVVRSDSLEAVTENNTPLRPTHSSVKSMSFLITSPSDRDTDLILQTTEAGVDELKKVLKGRPGTLGLEAMAEMGERSKAKSLEAVQDRLARAEHRALTIKNAKRVLGSVYATSGFRFLATQEGNYALDWSLAKILPSRSFDDAPSVGAPDQVLESMSNAKNFTEKIHGGLTVAKFGGSTGWTEGKVSAIKTVFLKGESKYTHDVLACPVAPLHRHKYDFATPGDSGAVVVVSDEFAVECGCWVGLLFAANLAAGTGFFVPMSLVLKDISEITGCQVVQPSKCAFDDI